MLPMGFPVLCVLRGQRLILDDEQVLGIFLLRRLRKIEAPGDDHLSVDDDVG
jgi:hypothetical protein